MSVSKEEIIQLLREKPLIASIRDDAGFAAALKSDIPVIFLLNSTILTIEEQCRQLAAAGKQVFVHIDLVEGLAPVPVAVDYIAKVTHPAGVLTTHSSIIKRATELGLCAIQRIFMLDGVALQRAKRNIAKSRPDLIELLPGMMPSIVKRFTDYSSIPVIAGGLLTQEADIKNALEAGAVGVSSTNPALWGVEFPVSGAGNESLENG